MPRSPIMAIFIRNTGLPIAGLSLPDCAVAQAPPQRQQWSKGQISQRSLPQEAQSATPDAAACPHVLEGDQGVMHPSTGAQNVPLGGPRRTFDDPQGFLVNFPAVDVGHAVRVQTIEDR